MVHLGPWLQNRQSLQQQQQERWQHRLQMCSRGSRSKVCCCRLGRLLFSPGTWWWCRWASWWDGQQWRRRCPDFAVHLRSCDPASEDRGPRFDFQQLSQAPVNPQQENVLEQTGTNNEVSHQSSHGKATFFVCEAENSLQCLQWEVDFYVEFALHKVSAMSPHQPLYGQNRKCVLFVFMSLDRPHRLQVLGNM